jgi:hypothetical protein
VALEGVLDPVQLGVTVGVVGLLPRLRALERHVALGEDLTQPFPAHGHDPAVVVGQVGGQLADAPPGERLAQSFGAGGGRLDDERVVVSRDPAGTATRPLRVQRSEPQFVEPVDHLPDPVL